MVSISTRLVILKRRTGRLNCGRQPNNTTPWDFQACSFYVRPVPGIPDLDFLDCYDTYDAVKYGLRLFSLRGFHIMDWPLPLG